MAPSRVLFSRMSERTLPVRPWDARRWPALLALAAVIALAWVYTLLGIGMGMTAAEMTAMSSPWGAVGELPALVQPVPWTTAYAVLVLLMWWIMMAAMMLPSAVPMLMVFAALKPGSAALAAFAGGYLLAWGGFSLAAVALQWGLERFALLTPMMVATSLGLGGTLLIVAGLWQFTPWKQVCLGHCRSPLDFVTHHWRDGLVGAWHMGLRHGWLCLGCCWGLMLLLFYGGVMNLYWIVGLSVLVLVEKLAPAGPWVARAIGAVLIAAGAGVLSLLYA